MQWLVYFLGVALMSGGVGALYSSIDLSGTERGTMLALTGTISLCGGVMTLGIGFILSAVNGISRSLRSNAGVGHAKAGKAQDAVAGVPRAPEGGQAEAVALAEPAPVEFARPALRLPRVSPGIAAAAAATAGVGAFVAGKALAARPAAAPPIERRVDPLLAQAESWEAGDWQVEPVAAQALADDPEAAHAGMERIETVQHAAAQGDEAHVEGAHVETADAETADVETARHVEAEYADAGPGVAAMDTAFAGQQSFAEIETAQGDEAPPPIAHDAAHADMAVPPAPLPEPVVVGRYNAGGAAYVMYSDGSIEAETPHGHYRFNSMSELKAFIEDKAAQEGTRELAGL